MDDRNEQDQTPPPTPRVTNCPFCGETIGSFWARRATGGEHWCESCQLFFTVSVAD